MVAWFTNAKILKRFHHALFIRFVLGLVISATLAGCDVTTVKRGNMPMAFQIEKINIGKTTQAGAMNILGSPTLRSHANENFWFYTEQTLRRHPLWGTELIDQQILAVEINDLGRVESLSRFQADPSGIIVPSENITSLTLKERTLIEQTLGLFFPGTL